MVTILSVMLYFEFTLTIILVTYLSVFPLFLYLYYKKKLRQFGELKQKFEFEITNLIMNAINNALKDLNIEMTSQPITPEKILKKMGKI